MRARNSTILCHCTDQVHCKDEVCEAEDGAPCFHYVEVKHNPLTRSIDSEHIFGCLQSPEHGGNYFQCSAGLSPHATPKAIRCCYNENFCNLKLNTTITAPSLDHDPLNGIFHFHAIPNNIVLVVFLALLAVLLVLCGFIYVFLMKNKKIFLKSSRTTISRALRSSSRSSNSGKATRLKFFNQVYKLPRLGGVKGGQPCSGGSASDLPCLHSPTSSQATNSFRNQWLNGRDCIESNQLVQNQHFLQETIDEETTGSGMGIPILVTRTIARELSLEKKVGDGRYGQVWKAKWRGDYVAAKIFSTIDEKSFFHEKEIYATTLFRHENILAAIGGDLMALMDGVNLVLVTEYCEYGSLYDFLKSTSVTLNHALKLMRTAAAGLDYLHYSVVSTNNTTRPAIAHRDIKSKNILVKPNFVSVIADFGLAVREENGRVFEKDASLEKKRVGTTRYMPPEMLLSYDEFAFNASTFDSYRRADIYSFSLVLWEISNRSEILGPANVYSVPYEDLVSMDPHITEMRRVVCFQERRPSIPIGLSPVLVDLLQTCWHKDAGARYTSRKIKMCLTSLMEHLWRT